MQVQTRHLGARAETLDHAIEAIRVRFGSQALTRVAEMPPAPPWPSGTALDRLTGIGGLPRGRLSLLTGTGTCGKLTLALALLAQATHGFAHTVVVDPAGQFDPWSMLPFDPDLGPLTVITPPSAEAAGEAASALARAGAGFILLMGEIPEPWLGPMEAGAARSGAVVVGVVDTPGRALAHASSLSLGFARGGWIYERGQLVGLRALARCSKNKLAPPVGESELEVIYFPPHRSGGATESGGVRRGREFNALPQENEECESAAV
jgi:recombination protein RecA